MKLTFSSLLWSILPLLFINCERSTDLNEAELKSSTQTYPVLSSVCNVKNPTDDLPWLKKMRDQVIYDKNNSGVIDKIDLGFEVYLVPYKGENILWVYSSIYNTYPKLYHCSGEAIDFPLNPYSDPESLALLQLFAKTDICAYKVYTSPGARKLCQ